VSAAPLARRLPAHLQPDPSRVIAELFVPGHYLTGGHEDLTSGLVERILALSDDAVSETIADLVARFDGRHRDLTGAFRRHAERIRNRLGPGTDLSDERWLLLGATFTHEYAVQAAALCNPSTVVHPDQRDVPTGTLRIVLSVRQIGEGHRSSLGFRTGLVDASGSIVMDEPGPFTTAGSITAGPLDADAFRGQADALHDDHGATGWVLDRLGERFSADDLDAELSRLDAQRDTRPYVGDTVRRMHELAARTYTASFSADTELSERVLYPASSVESNGIEDARFVRFTDDDGAVRYHASYTAFDGWSVVQQLLTTTDFRTFTSTPLLGAAAAGKGMALFPRRIEGRFAALSRSDGASNTVALSDDVRRWPTADPVRHPLAVWETVQMGNCGSPIETPDGWLVLTHGVGPMRTYSIGAWLLDLHDPTTIIGSLREPLLAPQLDEQDGYVPNVIYSCGALLHDGALLIPFGIGDATIGFASAPLEELVAALRGDGAMPRATAGRAPDQDGPSVS
jgi:predicted GH43/DUF377 family glycosyl hydrolase